MSDQNRVHEASPIRLLRARGDGMVARSSELSRSLMLCVLLGSMFLLAGSFQTLFADFFVNSTQNIQVNWSGDLLTSRNVNNLILSLLIYFASITALAVAAWQIQSPLNLKTEKAMPDISRLSPSQGWGRVFSASHWLKTLILICGFSIATLMTLSAVWNYSPVLASIATLDLKSGLALAGSFLQSFLLAAGIIILVLGLADYLRERIRISTQLRMTDQERRDEARNNEMDPDVRRRLIS